MMQGAVSMSLPLCLPDLAASTLPLPLPPPQQQPTHARAREPRQEGDSEGSKAASTASRAPAPPSVTSAAGTAAARDGAAQRRSQARSSQLRPPLPPLRSRPGSLFRGQYRTLYAEPALRRRSSLAATAMGAVAMQARGEALPECWVCGQRVVGATTAITFVSCHLASDTKSGACRAHCAATPPADTAAR